MTITSIIIDSITNHGSVIQIQGKDSKTGVLRWVTGDAQAIDAALDGLGIGIGDTVGTFQNDDGVTCLCDPDPNDEEARLLTLKS